MSVRCDGEQTRDDIDRFFRAGLHRLCRHSALMRLLIDHLALGAIHLLGLIALLIGMALVAAAAQGMPPPEPGSFAAPALLVLLLFLGFHVNSKIMIRLASAKRGYLGPKQYSIDAEGIHERSESGDETARWADIRAIDHDGEYIYVFKKRLYGYAIPRRFFESDDDYWRFLAQLCTGGRSATR